MALQNKPGDIFALSGYYWPYMGAVHGQSRNAGNPVVILAQEPVRGLYACCQIET